MKSTRFSGETLYRLGRQSDAWELPDWRCAGPDATFGNRWDDPLGEYRTLYACRQRLGTFLETLANYRPDPEVIAALAEIAGEEPVPPAGEVPLDWVLTRAMGTARVSGDFALVGEGESLDFLSQHLAGRVSSYHLTEFDLAAVREDAPRELAQEASRLVFEQGSPLEGGTGSGGRGGRFAGISYPSRFGDGLQILVLFEPEEDQELLDDPQSVPLSPDDPDLATALRLLGLRLEDRARH